MIYIHPTQLHSPLDVVRMEHLTGMRVETFRGKAILVPWQSPEPDRTEELLCVSDYIGDPPTGSVA